LNPDGVTKTTVTTVMVVFLCCNSATFTPSVSAMFQ